jgi:hypothetical protein
MLLLLIVKGARNIFPKLKKFDLLAWPPLSVIEHYVVLIIPAKKVVHVNE